MYYLEKRTIETEKNAVVCITDEVNESLQKSGVQNGFLVVEVPHSTTGIVRTTAFATDVRADLIEEARRLIPSRLDFNHQETPDDASGHIKCALFGNSVSAIVHDGKLLADGKLGYFLLEYDGPRKRTYSVCVLGE